jgi:hypothetical protein
MTELVFSAASSPLACMLRLELFSRDVKLAILFLLDVANGERVKKRVLREIHYLVITFI